jgi:two-component system phosphate regulon sensor histidine kinase PhoR
MKSLMEEVLACNCSKECFTKEISLDEGRWFRVNAVNLRDGDEKPLGYILVFHDATELKQLETVRADFVANVSHELRTPLTAIRGYAETLLRNPPADARDSEHFLSIIHRHSERLGRLIDDLLILSDLESGKIQLAKEEVEVNDLIGRVLEIFQDQASKKGVTLSHALEDNLAPILGDPDRLQQLLINLIDNAIKFTEKGHVTLAVRHIPEANSVEFKVAETGIGIPRDKLPIIFERFHQVDSSDTRLYGGVGLGLYIVKMFTELLGGEVEAASEPGKGSTFTVKIPVSP